MFSFICQYTENKVHVNSFCNYTPNNVITHVTKSIFVVNHHKTTKVICKDLSYYSPDTG